MIAGRSLAITLALAMLLLFVNQPDARSFPSTLQVKLFDSQGDLDEIEIFGPFQSIMPVQRSFAAGTHLIVKSASSKLQVYDAGKGKIQFARARAGKGPGGQQAGRSRSGLEAKSGVLLLTCNQMTLVSLNNGGLGLASGGTKRRYRGRIIIARGARGIRVVNDVSSRNYVASVVGSEAPLHSPLEALKAFAVLTLMIVDPKHDGESIGDSTREQVYKGAEFASAEVERAVEDVFEKRLYYKGSPVKVFYHSTCAGGTSSGAAIFGPAANGLVYLSHVDCDFCRKSPFWKEKKASISATRFNRILGTQTLPVIEKTDDCNRPVSIRLSGERRLSGYQAWIKLGRSLGWGIVPGTRFGFCDKGGMVHIKSSGAGHGVGLCQWGALAMARQGKSAQQILQFYFPGTELK